MGVEMDFRLLNEDQEAQRPVFWRRQPLRVKVADLNRHVDEIFEAQAIVELRQRMIAGRVHV